jgi:hypothetical protein
VTKLPLNCWLAEIIENVDDYLNSSQCFFNIAFFIQSLGFPACFRDWGNAEPDLRIQQVSPKADGTQTFVFVTLKLLSTISAPFSDITWVDASSKISSNMLMICMIRMIGGGDSSPTMTPNGPGGPGNCEYGSGAHFLYGSAKCAISVGGKSGSSVLTFPGMSPDSAAARNRLREGISYAGPAATFYQ